jgi:chromosome segregation ATPase
VELEAAHSELEHVALTGAMKLQESTDELAHTKTELHAAHTATTIISDEVEELESELAAAKSEMVSKQIALEQQMSEELEAQQAELSASKLEVASVRGELESLARSSSRDLADRAAEIKNVTWKLESSEAYVTRLSAEVAEHELSLVAAQAEMRDRLA